MYIYIYVLDTHNYIHSLPLLLLSASTVSPRLASPRPKRKTRSPPAADAEKPCNPAPQAPKPQCPEPRNHETVIGVEFYEPQFLCWFPAVYTMVTVVLLTPLAARAGSAKAHDLRQGGGRGDGGRGGGDRQIDR